MKVFVYWNQKDNDSKKIYQFLKNGSFLKSLSNVAEVDFYPAKFSFNIDDLKSRIESSDIVMFFTHGQQNAILKYRPDAVDIPALNFNFIDMNNAQLLANKTVFSICCSSAKLLGPYCIDSADVNCYIGFREPIIYDSNNKYIDSRKLVYDAYNKAFDETLTDALQNHLTANQFVSKLKSYTNNLVINNSRQVPDHSLGPFDLHYKLLHSINSLVALGNICAPLFG